MDTEIARDKLIVAYDFPSIEETLAFDSGMGEEISWVKVGLELFAAEGPRVVEALTARGRQVFLDLKLHDIPRTVAGGVRSAAGHGAGLLTLHASGGPKMMAAAAEARDTAGSGTRLLAVTVLTSLDGSEYPEIYRSDDVGKRVRVMARAAVDAGMDGIVCSPRELEGLRSLPPGFLRVTPGVRPADAETHDQTRTATPGSALSAGASRLVIGRPITAAPRPREAARAILAEMTAALASLESI